MLPDSDSLSAELVSGILCGQEGLAELWRLPGALHQLQHVEVNRTCGLHVHVGMSATAPSAPAQVR